MTFVARQINLQFTTDDGKVTNLEGLRIQAVALNAGGEYAVGQIQMRILGMTLEQMNQYSANRANLVSVQNVGLTVLAGNQGDTLGQLFQGGVKSSYIDIANMPEAAFVITAQAGMYEFANTVAPNTWKGTQNAEDVIESLAKSINFGFENQQGAHAVIQNQYTYGSAMSQIRKIIRLSNFSSTIENNTVSIFPNNGTVDEVVIDVSPENGLVGYPFFYEAGFIIKTEYNPDIRIGRTVNLKSQITKANGEWVVFEVTHELSTLAPDGPWFTTAKLGAPGTNSVSPN